MERVCFLLRVKPERLDEYRARHRAVWEPMLSALRDTGWRNYSLFLRPDGLLVGYLECDDFVAAQHAMEHTMKELQNSDGYLPAPGADGVGVKRCTALMNDNLVSISAPMAMAPPVTPSTNGSGVFVDARAGAH